MAEVSAELFKMELKHVSRDGIKLNELQNKAYTLMTNGENVFITGPAGTGKTSVIKMFTKSYRHDRKITITSSTGTSALLINGTTLHSYTGIGLGTGSVETIVNTIYNRSYLMKRWNELNTLVIDEISMISPDLFDKLEEVARIVRNNSKPFGGIQLILSGDFCQLPCVGESRFCFDAKTWNKCVTNTIYLTEIIRQSDTKFQKCLNSIRLGELPEDVISILQERIGKKITNKYGIAPTKLFPLNHSVDKVNEEELDKLAEDGREFYQYDMTISPYSSCGNNLQATKDKFRKNCVAPESFQLCVGAQVMLLYNMDLASKLANGSRGIVTGFSDDLPVVKFISGEERVIEHHDWDMVENGVKILKATQIPLKLAYAISIHKSQGCSLDCVEIDLLNVFEYGQAYAALSRAKTLEGLSITGIDLDRVVAHPDAVKYYENLTGNS